MASWDISSEAERLAGGELRFLEDLQVDFGQRRSRLVLALYLRGLRTCERPRTFSRIAVSLFGQTPRARALVERFNYQLNDRRERTGESWGSKLMHALAHRAAQRIRPRAFLLVAMYAPRLGSGSVRPRDISRRSAQTVALLLAAGDGPSGDLEAFPISWRLSFDDWWSADRFGRARVPAMLRRHDHIAVPATSMLSNADVMTRDLPIVASGSFAELRLGWLAAGQSYVVDWKQPTPAAITAVDQQPVDPANTIYQEIERRRERPWRDVRTSRVPTRVGMVTRIDAFSKFGTAETDLAIDGGPVWCAHLRGVCDSDVPERIIDYAALRESVRPIYQHELRQLGLDDYRGTSFAGWHAHRALVSAAYLLQRERFWPEIKGY